MGQIELVFLMRVFCRIVNSVRVYRGMLVSDWMGSMGHYNGARSAHENKYDAPSKLRD